MNKISRFIVKLVNREPLTNTEAEEAMAIMIKGGANPSQIATYLTAIKMQDITPSIIIGSVNYFLRVIKPQKTQNDLYCISFGSNDSFMTSVEAVTSLILSMFNINVIKNFSSISPINSTIKAIKTSSYNFDLTTTEIINILQENHIVFTESKNFYPNMIDLDYTCHNLEFPTFLEYITPLIQQCLLNGFITFAVNYNEAITLANALKDLSYKHAIIIYNDMGANHFCPGINNIITLSNDTINQSNILLPDNSLINFKDSMNFILENENYLFSNSDLNFIEFTSFNTAALLVIFNILPNFDEAFATIKTIFANHSIQNIFGNLARKTNSFL